MRRRALLALTAPWLLPACASFVDKPQRAQEYDLGSPAGGLPPPSSPDARVLVVPPLQSSVSLDTTAMLYRLDYHDGQVLRAYTAARWSAPLPQLVRERLLDVFAREYVVLAPADAARRSRANGSSDLLLRLDLQECAQRFDTPGTSFAELRLRATLIRSSPEGGRLLAQRGVLARMPAASPDAAGGVKALRDSVDAAGAELLKWMGATPSS